MPIIITSQHLYEIEAIADQMIILDGGQCIYAGRLDGLPDVVPLPAGNVPSVPQVVNCTSWYPSFTYFATAFFKSGTARAMCWRCRPP